MAIPMAALAPLDIAPLGKCQLDPPAQLSVLQLAASPEAPLTDNQSLTHAHARPPPPNCNNPLATPAANSSASSASSLASIPIVDLGNHHHATVTTGPAPSPATTAATSSAGSTSSSGSSSGAVPRKRKPTAAAASPPPTLPCSGAGAASTTDKAWTPAQDAKLRAAVTAEGPRNWRLISVAYFGGAFSDTQCLNRWYKVLRPGLVKGKWTEEEDEVIVQCMATGVTKWSDIAARIPGRLGKQCRERWMNHLDPSLKKGGWTPEEDARLFAAQRVYGNAWTKIAAALPGRSENAVKNRWNSADLRRRRAKGQAPAPAPAPVARPQQPASLPIVTATATPLPPTALSMPPPPPPQQRQQQQQAPAPMVVAAPAPTPVKRPHQEQEPEPAPTPLSREQQQQRRRRSTLLHDHGADMESISSISSASAVSMEEEGSESESEAEAEAEAEEGPADVQRSQLPPRHRGLQHHHTQHASAAAAAAPAVPAPAMALSGLAGLALAASALCDVSPAPAKPAPPQLPSQRMRDVISLLFSAMRGETDSTRRALLQDALDAASQEKSPMVLFIESCNMAVESDRLFLLDAILSATHRGVFGPCTFRL